MHLLKTWLFHRSDRRRAGKDWPGVGGGGKHFFGGLWLLHLDLESFSLEKTPSVTSRSCLLEESAFDSMS